MCYNAKIKLEKMTKADYIQWLETQIVKAQELGGMDLEIWAFRQCLKKARELGQELPVPDVVERSEQLKCGNSNPPCAPNTKFGCLECTECNWSE